MTGIVTGIVTSLVILAIKPTEETVYINNHVLNTKYKGDILVTYGSITIKRRIFSKSIVTIADLKLAS